MADADATQGRSNREWDTPYAIGDTVAGNYLIEGLAGRGGMGFVYRAHDLKLDRTVALKFLPSEVSVTEKEKQRFLKEARLAAALDHPNIGSIYGIDVSAQARTFIVMAYYEGPSLAERIHLGRPMEVGEVLDVAKQMARGLAEAHSRNIFHRDIKPSNVMFASAGLVKIVDFGLAYASEQTATLTQGAVGTAAYMAPEQALNRGADERADIWSLGVVMAEMLTRHNPFERETLPATVLAVLNDPPASLEGVPLEVQRIVYRALSKDRLKRYQTCREVLSDLKTAEVDLGLSAEPRDSSPAKQSKSVSDLRQLRESASESALNLETEKSRRPMLAGVAVLAVLLVAAAALLWWKPYWGRILGRTEGTGNLTAVLPQRPVLALLPFNSATGDAHLEALGQGLMETIGTKLTALSENRQFEVIPARTLREKGLATMAEARRQYGANLGLSLNLQPSGDLVTVGFQLQDAQSGKTLGGDSVTVPAADVFAVENHVEEGTVKALDLKLRPEEETSLKVHGTASSAAYNYYLQARGYLVDYTKADNLENAILMSREALKLDDHFGAARASLGEAYWRKYSLTKDQRLTEQAKQECEAAITLGNAGAAGHICLGLVYGGTGRYSESAAQYQLAVQLEPGNESAAIGLASMLDRQGAANEAEAAYQRVIDAHPQSYFAYNAMGGFYYRRSEYEKAIQMFEKVTQLAPENYAGYVNLGGTYNDVGRMLEAIEPLKKSISLRPSYAGYTNLGTSYLGLHKLKEAADAYQEAVKLDPKQYVTWGNLASAQNYSGSKDKARASYSKAIELASAELKVNPHDAEIMSDLSIYYATIDNRERAMSYLGQALQYGHNGKEIMACAAQVYNQLGETGLALEWMSKSIDAGYSARKFQDLVAFQNLVDNPRYQEIVGKGQHSR